MQPIESVEEKMSPRVKEEVHTTQSIGENVRAESKGLGPTIRDKVLLDPRPLSPRSMMFHHCHLKTSF